VSYAALDRLVDAAAARLVAAGFAAGQTVALAIAGPDEFRGLVAALALARIGVASADPALPAANLDGWIVEPGRPAPPNLRGIPIGDLLAAPAAPVPPHPGGAAVCRIFGSSGTTGTPKFAALSHALVVRRVMSVALSMGSAPAVRICGVGFGITWGFHTVLRTLWAGGTLVLTDPAQALAAIRRHAVTSLVIAPASLRTLVESLPATAAPLPSLREIEVGGSALPPRLYDLVRQRLCPTVIGYVGATEVGGVASAPLAEVPGAAGILHAGVTVEAVDEADRPLPAGTEGILRIRSALLAPGYLDGGAASEAVFRDGWFYSGDLGSVSADGRLTLRGRVSEVINAGGVKVSPQVIEDVLLAIPDVAEAAAFGVPDRLGVVQIWAAIVAPRPIPQATLQAACRVGLAGRAPRMIVQIKALPRNANGKVMREALVQAATQHAA
jgi:acyl-coenzyme A synthetase/AMP-(fatty) acid ligase